MQAEESAEPEREMPEGEIKVEPDKPQPQPQPTLTDSKVNEFYAKLNQQANEKSQRFFEYLVTVDEYSHNGETYKYKMLNRKNMGKLRKLLNEASELSEGKDFDAYSDNIMNRACILIQDMTPEKFDSDEADYELLEDIVGAWSIKYRGFRDFKQGI